MATGLVDASRQERLPIRLATTALPVERVGSKSFQARCEIVRSQHVTYQQKQHVFGYIAPTIGGTWNGYGSVYGGGGTIRSQSESVVTVVCCDFDDCEKTEELPASLSAREGTVLRLDYLNNVLFAAQNLSGKQEIRGLLGPASFIAWFPWTKAMTFLTVAAIVCLLAHVWVGAVVFAAAPMFTIYRQQMIKRERAQLSDYMGRALSVAPY